MPGSMNLMARIVADCGSFQWKIRKPKPACPPQQRRGKLLCTEWCAMCAMGADVHVLHVPPFRMLFRMLLCMLLCMLEAVEGGIYLLEVTEVMRFVCFCMLEAVDGELCLLEVLEAPGVMRRVLLCMLEAAEGGFCLLEAMEVTEMMELLEL